MPLFLAKTLLIAVALFPTVTGATAQTVKTLYSFKINGISAYPEYVALAQGRDGKFYGTTSGSTTDYGSVFTSGTEGGFDNLLSMDGTEGVSPYGGLTMGSDGNFYGTTSFGGTSNSGVFFRITPAGVYTVLHEFNGVSDGSVPIGPPIQASDGNFYGSTEGQSTIYEYMPSGSFSTIYQFTGTTGLNPFDSLTEGNDGNLYGTAHAGGASGCGTIFKISKAGKMLWYYSFPCGVGGLAPVASLIQASDGNFYGTTDSGGAYGSGTIFKMTPKGSVTILYSFGAIALDGSAPDGGLIQGTDGNLYGVTTLGGAGKVGTAYKITTAGVYSQLYSFTRSFGYYPLGRLTQHTDGQFYGTTNEGGADKAGIVYMLNMNLAPFVTFVRPTGAIGQTAQILGQGLTGTTAVSFNGVTASSFNVFSDTYITAVVPNGATTGAVTVTTPNGELTSNRSFQVLSSTGAYSRPNRSIQSLSF
jgi:uncharacterized repeat protein (TIGR03803 family)